MISGMYFQLDSSSQGCPVCEHQELAMRGPEYHILCVNHFCISSYFLSQVVQISLLYLYFPLDCPQSRLQLIQGAGGVKAYIRASKPPTQPDTGEFVEHVLPSLLTHVSVDQYK